MNSGKKIDITWKLYSKNFLILDLEVEKISLIQSQKSETISLLKKVNGNFSNFLKLFNDVSIG